MSISAVFTHVSGQVLSIAKSHLESADVLDAKGPQHFYAAAVLYALSIELMLKGCNCPRTRTEGVADGSPFLDAACPTPGTSGHRLEELFAAIDPDLCEHILLKYYGQRHRDLREELAEYSNYFIDARYPYEKKMPMALNDGIKRVARSLYAALQSVLHASSESCGEQK